MHRFCQCTSDETQKEEPKKRSLPAEKVALAFPSGLLRRLKMEEPTILPKYIWYKHLSCAEQTKCG